MTKDLSNYMTCSQAAELISKIRGKSITVMQVQHQCKIGRIKAEKLSRIWLIDKAEVEAYAKIKHGGWRPRKNKETK